MTPQFNSLSTTARRVLVSVNPKAGARSGRPVVEELKERLTQGGLEVELFTNVPELAATADEYWQRKTLRCVVAAGGDGTASLVTSHLSAEIPLMVLPLGTENLLSKFLGVLSGAEPVADVILDGITARLDAGQASEQLFLLMAGCGFDAEVVRRMHAERTGNIHHFSYAKPILDSIRNYQYPELRVYCDPDSDEVIEARWVFVFNLPRYAGGLQFAPHAEGTDGLLDVCTFRDGSFVDGLRYLTGVLLGQHESWNDCVTRRTNWLRVESDDPVPYQLDGDPGGYLPADIRVLPGRLTAVVPRDWAVRNGYEPARTPATE